MMSVFRARYRWACLVALSVSVVAINWAQFEATGLVQPHWEATLSSTVLGRVKVISVKEGNRVEAGSTLLQLERTFEELDAHRRQIVAESKVELELAGTKLEVLRNEYEGTLKIFEGSGSISKEELERARLDYRLAESELAQLEQREKIEALELQLALEQVARRAILAPQSGVIVDILPEVGEVCEARQPLIRMVDSSTVRIALDVDALKTAGVVEGARVPVMVESPEGGFETVGVVDFVSPVVDGASGLRRIRVSIDNSDGKILPGLPAMVRFAKGE